MTTLSYTIPVAGTTLNSLADPELVTALQAIQTWGNGNIDPTNLKSVFPSGLLSARPAASAVGGTFYYATDAGLLYWSTGAAWNTVSTATGAGAWQALTLATGIIAATSATIGVGYTPSARLEGTDVIRLKGAVQNNSGGSLLKETLFATLPGGLAPTATVRLQTPYAVDAGLPFAYVDTAGGLRNGTQLASAAIIPLDGLTYTLS